MMSALLAIVPLPYRWLALLALLAAFGGFCYVKGAQREQRVWEARAAAIQTQQLQQQIAIEHRRQDAVQEITNDLRKQAAAARAAADRNRDAGVRLRDQLAAACLGQGASPASGGPAADATARVLADVQRRLAEAEDRLVDHADASRRAGLGCERAYEALNPPPKE